MKERTEMTFVVSRLAKHPQLKARFEAILDVAENTQGNLIQADEVEQQAIEPVRQLGNEVLPDCAEQRVAISANEFKEQEPKAVGHGQKKIVWHTTFGEIEVRERLFIRLGKQWRPFSTSAGIHCRGCSLPLPRVIVDFGADHAFSRASAKLREHYGINIATSTIRRVTEYHANQMLEREKPVQSIPKRAGCAQQIGEMDGSMIPIKKLKTNENTRPYTGKKCAYHWYMSKVA